MSVQPPVKCTVCGVRWFGAAEIPCPNVSCTTHAVQERASEPEPTPRDPRDVARISELKAALSGLVERVERVGGYATTADQLVLARARQALR